MSTLRADRGELARFIGATFRYAEPGTYIALRGFDQFTKGGPARLVEAIKVNGSLDEVVERAAVAVEKCANSPDPIVFAPPICTFSNSERARGVDLAEGLVLSVELDEGNTMDARRRLESLLGLATAVVASGGEWIDPETGEIHAKLHLHWRLSEPTREEEDHAKLRQARDFACHLVGADPTGKPVVHPLRWPGSWNLKSDRPVLARGVVYNESSEINLQEALDALSEAVEAAGLAKAEMPRSGTPQAPTELVSSAMMAIPNAGIEIHYDQWIRLGYATYRATAGSDDGRDIWDAWSKKSDKYNATEQDAAWKRISRAVEGSTAPRTIGAGTIFFYASQAGWVRPQADSSPPPTPSDDPGWWHSLEQSLLNGAEVAEVRSEDRGETSAPELDGKIIEPVKDWTAAAPLREWVVEGWIPRGYVTGIYGDGAVGKSLIVQQLLSSVACSLPWLGLPTRGGRAFGFMCEDDAKELHRRQEGINRSIGIGMQNLENLRLAARFGFDNILMTFDDRNRGEPTILFAELAKFLTSFPPTIVVLDTLADIFGGNEIVRAHARQFVQGVGGQIARQFNCGVVIAAHPSASGIATGSGSGGSTAWSNTFRSRLYMTRPEGENADDDVRHLSRMKANYAPKGGELILRWHEGAFRTDGASQPAQHRIEWDQIDLIFAEIDRAWQANDPWSNAPQTKKDGRYLPLWASVTLGLHERLVASYVDKWLAGGYLKSEVYDLRSKAKGLRVIRRLQPTAAAEVSAEVGK